MQVLLWCVYSSELCEADVGTSLVTRIQEKTPISTYQLTLWHFLCPNNSLTLAVEAGESHKPPAIIATVTRLVLVCHMSEPGVFRGHLRIQITYHNPNATIRKSLHNCVQLLVESILFYRYR